MATLSVAFIGIGLLGAYMMMPVVTVTHLADGPVVQAFYATGTVRPVREYPVKSAAAGILTRVIVDKGDRVKAGDTLAVVHDPGMEYSAASADATLEQMRKTVDEATSPVLIEFDQKLRVNRERQEIAQREVSRLESLLATRAASLSDRDVALDKLKMLISEQESLNKQRAARVLELQRDLTTAEAGVAAAHWQLDQQTLRAPIDGVVLDRPTSQGTRVAINDTLMRIADVKPNNLVMRAQVDEEDVTHCHDGQLVRMSLYAFAGEPLTGRVRQIYDEADPDRRTFEVDVSFDHAEGRLAAGMTGELAFVESEKPVAAVLPATAVQNGRVCVVRGGKLVVADAKIGLKSVERVEVVSGLDKDEEVVVSPLGDLSPGSRVRSRFVAPSAVVAPTAKTEQAAASNANLKSF